MIAFALWYWEFDRGGPVARALAIKPYPDFEFPQMTSPELAPPSWEPMFADYFYLSFTNATAFSPTDVMPLSRWAKMLMLVQSAVSLSWPPWSSPGRSTSSAKRLTQSIRTALYACG